MLGDLNDTSLLYFWSKYAMHNCRKKILFRNIYTTPLSCSSKFQNKINMTGNNCNSIKYILGVKINALHYKFDGKEELLLLTLTCKMTSDLTTNGHELELTPR